MAKIWKRSDCREVSFALLHLSNSEAAKKFSKPGLNSTWTMNFQMFKLDLEKAEEPEIKLPTSAGSSKKQESSRKHLLLVYWLCQSLWLCGSQQTVENSKRDGNTRPSYLLYVRKQRRTKEPLDESERGEWKSWLKILHSENKDHGIWSHHFMANRWGNNGNSERLYFFWAPKSLQMVTAVMKLKDACSLKEKLWPT